MKRVKLYAAALETLPPGQYPDNQVDGLYLRIGAQKRTWFVRCYIGKQQRRHIIGYHPKMGLAEARKTALVLAEQVDAGKLPPPPPVHPRLQTGKTVGQIIDLYEAFRRRENVRIRNLHDALRAVRKNLDEYLDVPARQFTKGDLHAAFRAIRDEREAPTAAGRFIAYFAPIWKWANGEPDLEADVPINFARDIRKPKTKARDRVLNDRELAAIWWAVDHIGAARADRSYAGIIRTLILTGQRLDEVASCRRGRIFDCYWIQNPEDNKGGRRHRLKMPRAVIELMAGEGGPDEFVFPGHRSGRPVSGFSKYKAELDRLSGIGGDKALGDPKHWQIHDLRRTMSTNMQDMGIPLPVIHAIQNHAQQGLDAVYMQGEQHDLKAEALARWAERVAEIVAQYRPAEKVVPITRVA